VKEGTWGGREVVERGEEWREVFERIEERRDVVKRGKELTGGGRER